jgi:hypothetical protein
MRRKVKPLKFRREIHKILYCGDLQKVSVIRLGVGGR